MLGIGLSVLLAPPRLASGQEPPAWTARLTVREPVRLRLTTGEVRTGSIHAILDGRLAIQSERGIDSLRYDLIGVLDRHRDRETLKTGLLTGVGAGILAGLTAYLAYRSGNRDRTRAELAGRVASYGALGGFAVGLVLSVARPPWVRIYP